MKNQKEYCEKLYQGYKKLLEKTRMQIHDLGPGGKIMHPIPNIDLNDILRKNQVREELVQKCKLFLNLRPHEWFTIEDH